MGEYSPTPKPRRGHRRANGGGTLAGDEPRIAGVNAPLHANTPTPARKETSGKSAANRGNLRHARGSVQEHLTPEERARLEWMREQKPPHWG